MPLLAPPKVSLKDLLMSTSASDQMPSLDLEWEPFQAHVESFLKAIDDYTIQAKTEIQARANDHVHAVRDRNAKRDAIERAIQAEEQNERDMLETIETERHTVADLSAALQRLQAQLSKTGEQAKHLDKELALVRNEISAERGAKEREGKILSDMRSQDQRELEALEGALGLTMSGFGANRLLFVFTLIDPSQPLREFSFVLDFTGNRYTVPQIDPSVHEMPQLLDQLNTDRHLYGFVKQVRKAFVALVAPSQTKFADVPGPLDR